MREGKTRVFNLVTQQQDRFNPIRILTHHKLKKSDQQWNLGTIQSEDWNWEQRKSNQARKHEQAENECGTVPLAHGEQVSGAIPRSWVEIASRCFGCVETKSRSIDNQQRGKSLSGRENHRHKLPDETGAEIKALACGQQISSGDARL
jgi:hypothetical protein